MASGPEVCLEQEFLGVEMDMGCVSAEWITNYGVRIDEDFSPYLWAR